MRGAEVVAKDVISDGGGVQDFIDVVSISGQYRQSSELISQGVQTCRYSLQSTAAGLTRAPD